MPPKPLTTTVPSLQAFDEVLPAAGAIHSAVRISPAQLAEVGSLAVASPPQGLGSLRLTARYIFRRVP